MSMNRAIMYWALAFVAIWAAIYLAPLLDKLP